ncbi:hypothetical protein QBC44DRAFT_358499 [Cladorrhinum sp. PSN332]|nr:hypothetical protein QBC44DRAFT_358499 [Cladorrhinum sp. PSN332]
MAVGLETFERLEKGLDRLERFFSKKKKRVAPHSLVFSEDLPSTDREGFIPTFPSPSFIRPISSRMVAREEVNLSGRLARRAHSLPEPTGSSRLISSDINTTANRQLSVSPGCPQVPQRASSASSGPPPISLAELLEFSFSAKPSKESDNNVRPCRRSRSGSKTWSRCSSSSVSPGAQVTRKRRSIQDGELPPVAAPPLSPRLTPLPEPTADEFEMELDLEYQTSEAFDTDLAPSPLCISSKADPILKEPTVDDFLSLSDDDIADDHAVPQPHASSASKPPRFPLPPNPPSAPTSPPSSNTYPFLTLSPPLASRPAAAAAFEAAKLATKYQFDLVYIVNLWPKDMGRSQYRRRSSRRQSQTATPSPPTSPISSIGSTDSSLGARRPFGPRNSQRATPGGGGGLTGRLLAAYGLTSLMFPFRISEPVHQKVLRTDGWLEYRGESDADYFTRGYSCSFYTGHSPTDKREEEEEYASSPSPSPSKRRRTTTKAAANRGIVFAAYRRPAVDGTRVAVQRSDPSAELEALHRDAEELVDMLLDIHMTHRRPSIIPPPQRCVATHSEPLALSSKMPLVAA